LAQTLRVIKVNIKSKGGHGMKNVLIVGTFDTKGHEFKFIKELIEKRGLSTTTINCGVIGEPLFVPDVLAVRRLQSLAGHP
jgi:uncharacterized protein (UPF0261 family)